MNAIEEQARSVFLAFLDRAPDQGAAFLDDACGDNAELRARVEQLLHAHEAMGSIHGGPVKSPAATIDEPTRAKSGTIIGPFKLLQQIGEGGMGTVFLAEQSQPVQRRVALKIVKSGMDSRQVLARFEAERQALALMDHPHIAKVLDAGTTESGRPYFVMELVKGVPITRYCDDHRLTLQRRLELFVPVCQAVQHAHQKGIIHRDLKPSNVLVAEYDDKPIAKVIDFGVAKATGSKLTQRTLFTELGQIVGTLEYMSPEQAKLNALDIDTRSDIYALGALLYELLTGTTPLERARVRRSAFDEMLRVIREEEPPKPSTRLSATEEVPSIAANRRLEPKKLSGLVRGELDWIVMKALEKDRNRRYETANGFAQDIQRYLADEPVQACPPSASYRLRKLVRRNKRLLTAVVAVAASLLVGLSVAIVLLVIHAVEMQEAHKLTTEEYNRAETALKQAKGNLERADQNLRLALKALDEVYVRDPKYRIRQDKRMAEAERKTLQKGLQFYEQFAQQNIGHEELKRATAKAYQRAGSLRRTLKDWAEAQADFAQAIAILEKWADESHGSREDQEELARCYYGMTHSLQKAGQHGEAAPFCRRAIALFGKLAADRQDPYDRFQLGQSLGQMAVILSSAGQPEKAEEALRQSLRLFEGLMAEYPTEPFSRPKAGSSHHEEGDTLRTVLPLQTEYADQLGYTARNLSFLLPGDRMQEKLALFQKAADVYGKLCAAHPHVSDFLLHEAYTHRDIGDVLATLKRYEEADKAYRKAVDLFQKLRNGKFGPGMYRSIKDEVAAYTALANFLMARNRPEDAVTVLRQASAVYEKFPNDPDYQSARVRSQYNLAELLQKLGQKEEAAKAFREVLPICEKLAADFPTKQTKYTALVGHTARHLYFLLPGDRMQEKLALLQKAADVFAKLGAAHPDVTLYLHFEADTHRLLGDVLSTLKRYEEAEKAYRKAVDLFQKLRNGKFSPGGYRNISEEVWGYRALANFLFARNRSDDATNVLRQAIALYEKFPNDLGSPLILGHLHSRLGQWDKVIADYSKAIELNPKRSELWSSRGFAHLSLRQWDKSIQDYTKAIELAPDVHASNALYFRAVGYVNLNQPERAVADLRQAITKGYSYLQGLKNDGRFAPLRTREDFQKLLAEAELEAMRRAITQNEKEAVAHPNEPGPHDRLARSHYNLGNALKVKGQLEEAIAEYKDAIRLKKDYAEAHCNLGNCLLQKGQFRQAVKELRCGHELGSKNPRWPYPSAQWLRNGERLVELDGKLPAILSGQKHPADNAERLGLAQLCQMPCKQRYAAAVRFFRDAFDEEPKLADDLNVSHRYNAACAAALAGCGQGQDADKLDTQERARLRQQALDWLRADLEAWRQQLGKEAEKSRSAATVAKKMRHWLADRDFAGVRGVEALAKLPEGERQAWQKLWDDVAVLLGRATGMITAEKKSAAK